MVRLRRRRGLAGTPKPVKLAPGAVGLPASVKTCDMPVHRGVERRRIDADLGGPSALVAMVTALNSLASARRRALPGRRRPGTKKVFRFSASGCVSEFG